MNGPPDAVIGNLHDSLSAEREPVISRPRDVRAEDRESRRLEERRIPRRQVEHRLSGRVEVRGQGREQIRSPRARRQHHPIGRIRAFFPGHDPRDARSRLIEPLERAPLVDAHPGGLRLAEQLRHHAAALGISADRVEIPIDVHPRAPRGKSRPDRRRVEALDRVSPPREPHEALVLEPARRHRRARQEGDPDLVIERLFPAGVPAAPAVDRRFHQRQVGVVRAVVEAHHLADVGRLRERVRDRARIEDRHLVPAPPQRDRGRHAEDPGAHHRDAHQPPLRRGMVTRAHRPT
ncbi:MAG: hypothetical protein QM820_18800 [Minicystis sp.]